MVYTLGLHNSNVASSVLFKDNVLIGAVSEERFTREKNCRGIPTNSINYLLNEAGITLEAVDEFCYTLIKNRSSTHTKKSTHTSKKSTHTSTHTFLIKNCSSTIIKNLEE